MWETHHFATLIGYGASGVNPYLVFQTIHDMKKQNLLPEDLTEEKAIYNYKTSLEILGSQCQMLVTGITKYSAKQPGRLTPTPLVLGQR